MVHSSQKFLNLLIFLLVVVSLTSCKKNSQFFGKDDAIAQKDTLFFNFARGLDTISLEKKKKLFKNFDSIVKDKDEKEKNEYRKYFEYSIVVSENRDLALKYLSEIDTSNHTNLLNGYLELRKLQSETSQNMPSGPQTIEKAIKTITKLEKQNHPYKYSAYEILSRIYFNSGDLEKSKKYINLWYNSNPNKNRKIVKNTYNQILFLYAMRQHDMSGMERYQKEIEKSLIDNNDSFNIAQSYEKKSILLGMQGKYDSSISIAKLGLKYSPKYHVLQNNISESYLRKKDYVNCIKYAKEGVRISLEKDSTLLPELYSNINNAYFELEDYKKAYEYKILEDEAILKKEQKNKTDRIAKIEKEYHAQKDITVNSLKAADQLKAEVITQQKWILASILFLGLLSFFLFLNWRKKNRLRVVKNMIVSENEKLKLEQTVLQLKLSPHFIYNTVSNLQGLISQNKSEESISYLNKFARLMRSVLEFDQEEYISIREEVEQISDYIQLQQMRYQGAFDYHINIDENINQENQLVPPMLLQPFIENAIVHGFNGINYHGRLVVSLQNIDEKHIQIIIEDNGKGTSEPTKKSPEKQSLSTKIIERRLKILYGDDAASLKKIISDSGCKITLVLPKTSEN